MSTTNVPSASVDDSTTAGAAAPGADGGGLGVAPREPIVTLPPLDDSFRGVPVSARTGAGMPAWFDWLRRFLDD